MDVRRRQPANTVVFSDEPLKMNNMKKKDSQSVVPYVINALFFALFFSMAYFLLLRWRDKIRTSTPLHFVTISDIAAIFSLIASFIYLMLFFGISFVLHPFAVSDTVTYDDEAEFDVVPNGELSLMSAIAIGEGNEEFERLMFLL